MTAIPARLAAEWEARLASEGLAPIRFLTQTSTASGDGLVCVSATPPADHQTDDGSGAAPEDWAVHVSVANLGVNNDNGGQPFTVAELDAAEHWRRFSADVQALPRKWPRRDVAVLERYAEHGILLRAAREARVSYRRARTALTRFQAHRTASKRTAPKGKVTE